MEKQTLSVLIVEGNTENALRLESKVMNAGHKVAARIYDPVEVKQFVQDFRVDLVLMNMNVDGKYNAHTLAQEIVNCSESKVILLSDRGKRAYRIASRQSTTDQAGFAGSVATA